MRHRQQKQFPEFFQMKGWNSKVRDQMNLIGEDRGETGNEILDTPR